jgi:hypothetical protein
MLDFHSEHVHVFSEGKHSFLVEHTPVDVLSNPSSSRRLVAVEHPDTHAQR